MGVASAMVGAKVKRREDPRLITGHASYVDDFQPTGLTHMVFVRSPHAHAKIKSINLDAAKKSKASPTPLPNSIGRPRLFGNCS